MYLIYGTPTKSSKPAAIVDELKQDTESASEEFSSAVQFLILKDFSDSF